MKKITLLMLIVLTTITTQAQNKLLSSIYEYYYNNTWNNSSGYNYEYDSNNNLTIETRLNWNSNSDAWEVSDKTIYTYNASNKVTQEIYQSSYNSPTNTLENSYKTINTYNAGKLTESLEYYWENANWVIDYKSVITYNANNLPSVYLSYKWDSTKWINDERTTFTYNANNKVLSDVFEEWDGSQWVNSYKSLYTYNANNKLTSERGANWDVFNTIWVEAGAYRVDYVLDATGNRTIETNSGNYEGKTEYTYDITKLMSNFAHPFKDKTGVDYFAADFPYINKVQVENSYSYNNQTSSFDLSGRTTYNYNTAITLSTDTFEKEVATITVYPNPTQDFLNIQKQSNTEIDTVIVTDLTGKKVLEQNNSSQIDVQKLAKGVYVLEAISGKNRETKKFIKE